MEALGIFAWQMIRTNVPMIDVFNLPGGKPEDSSLLCVRQALDPCADDSWTPRYGSHLGAADQRAAE
jgi:hypothetical protein